FTDFGARGLEHRMAELVLTRKFAINRVPVEHNAGSPWTFNCLRMQSHWVRCLTACFSRARVSERRLQAFVSCFGMRWPAFHTSSRVARSSQRHPTHELLHRLFPGRSSSPERGLV